LKSGAALKAIVTLSAKAYISCEVRDCAVILVRIIISQDVEGVKIYSEGLSITKTIRLFLGARVETLGLRSENTTVIAVT